MWAFLGLGLSMGLSAGLSPGPLLTLVVTASLRSGWAGGSRVALAPFITDAPIIAVSVLLIGRLPPEVFRWVGTVGGLVVLWLAVETLRSARAAFVPGRPDLRADPRGELKRGVLVNALNPQPYLFWATIGGPAVVRGWRVSAWHALAFLLSFYVLLIGSQIVVAWLVSRRAGGLPPIWYRRVLAGCGLLLFAMGGWLIWTMWAG
jgi:threonine/homoserine/homoserine lactone efflux protein